MYFTFDIKKNPHAHRWRDHVGCNAKISARFLPADFIQSQMLPFNRRDCNSLLKTQVNIALPRVPLIIEKKKKK